jgi:hypothetical protein
VIGFLVDCSLVDLTLNFSEVLGELCQLFKLGESDFEVARLCLSRVFVLLVGSKAGMLEDILNNDEEEDHVLLSLVI